MRDANQLQQSRAKDGARYLSSRLICNATKVTRVGPVLDRRSYILKKALRKNVHGPSFGWQ